MPDAGPTIGASYNVSVPIWTDKEGNPRGGYAGVCELVSLVAAGEVPDPDWVTRYYGEDAPRGVYRPSTVDRLVFRRTNGSCLIMPDAPRNRGCWWPVACN